MLMNSERLLNSWQVLLANGIAPKEVAQDFGVSSHYTLSMVPASSNR
jgi:hypothetical protein